MPKENRAGDLTVLRNLIDEAHDIVTTVELPQGRAKRAATLLSSALALADDLIAVPPAAVTLGRLGGRKTAERGPKYFAKISALRKTKAGGRPRKQD
jgi:hypothetical protein